MQSYIELKNMRFFAFHGVLPEENIVGNSFVVNVKIGADLSAARESDNVENTINYAAVYEIVKCEMQIVSQLLEHVTGRIFDKIKSAYPQINRLEVRLAKLNPPVGGEVESAEIIFSD